jgi:hypothetical protein
MSAALLVCMPDEWTTDDEAQSLIHRLSNDEAAIVLAWLATQWRDGYSAAVVDLRAGRRPLTELERLKATGGRDRRFGRTWPSSRRGSGRSALPCA